MSESNRVDAQRRADEIRVFRAEPARPADAGVLRLEPAQQAALTAHHDSLLATLSRSFDIDRDARASKLSLGMRIASFLGAVALAASLYFLFYQFWGWLGAATQVAILIAAPLSTLALAAWLADRQGAAYFAKLAALVCFACLVLNLSMFGQIFNMTPIDNALLPWAALALLLAYFCDMRLLLVVGLLCLAGWIAARAGAWDGMYWLSVGERPENFLPAGVLAFALPWLVGQRRYPGFAATYRIFCLLCLLTPVLVLGNWGEVSWLPWPSASVEAFYQALGFALSAAAIGLGVRCGWGDSVNTGVVHTGWDPHWGSDAYFEGHPHLTSRAAEFLRDQGAALVGIDSFNIDSTEQRTRQVHTVLLGAGIPIVEHMTGLSALPASGFRFSAVPPEIRGMGTFPVRAHACISGAR